MRIRASALASSAQRRFSASPLAAEGHIYFTNEEGVTTVMEAGTTAKKLAENRVDGRTLASLATSDHAIFLRTDTALYRIQRQDGNNALTPVAAKSQRDARPK